MMGWSGARRKKITPRVSRVPELLVFPLKSILAFLPTRKNQGLRRALGWEIDNLIPSTSF